MHRIGLGTTVEISDQHIIYHTQRNYYCTQYTLGWISLNEISQVENSEYTLTVL